ncbi:DUF393 domain-containing protein [Embleya sp. NPDC005575]|uniref:thiol-disulfide oxidoreductase DCC family protein n=1 Tax=Embleya sp. NPDC005575 TaxID=3156892 RepID=UPI0033BF69B1
MTADTPGATPHAVLLYDGDCGFCHWSVTRLRRLVPLTVTITPWQATDLGAYGLTTDQVSHAVHWLPHRGPVRRGHEAFAAWLRTAPPPWSLMGRIITTPPIAYLARRVYRLVADHRAQLPGPWRAGATCRVPTQGSSTRNSDH